jgi:hypothetical protein
MEPLFKEKGKREKAKREEANGDNSFATAPKRSAFSFFLFPFALCLTGCINTGSFVVPGFSPPPAGPTDVVAAWNPEVVARPDPANRGAPTKGLAGRMYLFGEGSDCPLIGDGCVVVDLYEQPVPNVTSDIPLEEWRIDRDTLKRLLRRDAVGWGYTLFLPWGTFRPDITHVELRLRYDPVKGSPLYAEPSSVVLQEVKVFASSAKNSHSGPDIKAVSTNSSAQSAASAGPSSGPGLRPR